MRSRSDFLQKIVAVAPLTIFLVLAGCSPQPVVLGDGSCSWPKVGDNVKGTAILRSWAGTGCIECGARLTQAGCQGRLSFRFGSAEAEHDYDRITRRLAGEPRYEPIERTVFVTGKAIAGRKDGTSLLIVSHVAPAQVSKQ